MIELYEIRIADGLGSCSSIFIKGKTFDEACHDAEVLYVQMKRMGVDVGRVELRDEQDRLVECHFFTGAADRARAKRQQARINKRIKQTSFA